MHAHTLHTPSFSSQTPMLSNTSSKRGNGAGGRMNTDKKCFPRSHPALRSHRRAGMNTECSKFHHSHFIWETKMKPENKKSGYKRQWGGGWGTHSSNYPCPLTAVCAQRPVLSHMRWMHLHQRHLFKQNSFLRRLTLDVLNARFTRPALWPQFASVSVSVIAHLFLPTHKQTLPSSQSNIRAVILDTTDRYGLQP